MITYKPPPTLERFMRDGESDVRCAVGPIGSGKSMSCIFELLRRAAEQKPYNKVRYTRFAIIRNTLQQLRQTVLKDINEYLGPLVSYYATESTIRIKLPLADGTLMDSEWLLIPLDKQEDQQRLLSLQLTGAWINEVREVPFEIIGPLLGRLGRFPSKLHGGPTWHGLVCDTNPWNEDSKYHEVFVLKPEKGWALYHQPDALGIEGENVENLVAGYYERLVSGQDQDWVDVHVHSRWGVSNAGQAVFRRSFDASKHVRDFPLRVSPIAPVIVMMDFGRTPCAVIGQVDVDGSLICLDEITTEDMGLVRMLDDCLLPLLSKEPYAGRTLYVVADPAGAQKGPFGEETAFDLIRGRGYRAYPAPTNNIGPRLLAVEKQLTMTAGKKPGLIIRREGCPVLIRALAAQYRYRRKRDGMLEDTPEKLHPWSDVADALQYGCLSLSESFTGMVARRNRFRPPQRQMPVAAWT